MRHQQSIFELNVDPSTGSDSVVVVSGILLAFASRRSRTMLSSRLRRQVVLNVADPDLDTLPLGSVKLYVIPSFSDC
jgi:hypothetical protein